MNGKVRIGLVLCLAGIALGLISGCNSNSQHRPVVAGQSTHSATGHDGAKDATPPLSDASSEDDLTPGVTASEQLVPASTETTSRQGPTTNIAPEPTAIDLGFDVDANDPQFHDAIQKAADEYLRYALVNPEPWVAPAACGPAQTEEDQAAKPRQSIAEEGAHGKKLYFLFAKNIANYFETQKQATIGQVLVKESWTSKPSNPDARNLRQHASANRINPRTYIDGKKVEIAKRKSLFVMIKQAPDTPGTDEGWVYGIIKPETKEILASGRVGSCMACHQEPIDRMFRKDIVTIVDERVVEDKCLGEIK